MVRILNFVPGELVTNQKGIKGTDVSGAAIPSLLKREPPVSPRALTGKNGSIR